MRACQNSKLTIAKHGTHADNIPSRNAWRCVILRSVPKSAGKSVLAVALCNICHVAADNPSKNVPFAHQHCANTYVENDFFAQLNEAVPQRTSSLKKRANEIRQNCCEKDQPKDRNGPRAGLIDKNQPGGVKQALLVDPLAACPRH